MFLCCCICSSNIFISSISDKPQMQTDTKITKSPLMITNIYYNIHNRNRSKLMIRHNNQPSILPRPDRIVRRAFVQVLPLSSYWMYNNTIADEQCVQTWIRLNAQVDKMICNNQNRCTSFDTIQQSTIHFAVPCRIVLLSKRCHRHRIKYTTNGGG